EQRGLADQWFVDALLPGFTQETRALFFVEIDEDRIGICALKLNNVGREIGLTGLRGVVDNHLYVAGIHFFYEVMTTTLARDVIHPQHADSLCLDPVSHVIGDLRHTELLTERGPENVRVTLLCDGRSLATDDFGDFRLLSKQHVD